MVLYERLKRQDQNFVAIGSAEDETQIKELNKDPEKKRLKKRVVNEEDTAKGDLKIMMESSTEENDQGVFWNNQQDWEIVSWRLYEACRVCILELKDGTVIYMLVERSEELASPGSNSSVKISNLLLADKFLNTIWLSMYMLWQ
ncbi:hypothetical protein Tco_1413150 [Tanacetum coccineum]